MSVGMAKMPVVFLQVSILLSRGVRQSRDNVSGLPIGLNKGITGWGSTYLCIASSIACYQRAGAG